METIFIILFLVWPIVMLFLVLRADRNIDKQRRLIDERIRFKFGPGVITVLEIFALPLLCLFIGGLIRMNTEAFVLELCGYGVIMIGFSYSISKLLTVNGIVITDKSIYKLSAFGNPTELLFKQINKAVLRIDVEKIKNQIARHNRLVYRLELRSGEELIIMSSNILEKVPKAYKFIKDHIQMKRFEMIDTRNGEHIDVKELPWDELF